MRYLSVVFLVFLVASLIIVGVYAWANRYPEIDAIKGSSGKLFDASIVEKGAALAAIGNCAYCHTKAGGSEFAGRRKHDTPFGEISSINITPDVDTGIGAWS